MSTTNFNVKEHIVEAQHIREYARATSFSEEEILKLAVKQYTPLDNPNPQPGDVTIIGAHANGFPKASASSYSSTYPCSFLTLILGTLRSVMG